MIIRYKNMYIPRLKMAYLSCKLTSNFNTAVTVISTQWAKHPLSWNSSLSAFHQLKHAFI
jgi:hypothetical protein